MAIQLEPTTGVSAKRHFVTLAEFDRMVMSAVFEPDASVELIRGIVLDMPPPGPEHEAVVSRLHMFLGEHLRRRAILWPQGNSIGLPKSNSRLQPDITILKWLNDYYAEQRPRPEDVILLIEVSDNTLKYDRSDKMRIYAEAGIQEYWIVNLVAGIVEVHTGADQEAGNYRTNNTATMGQTLPLPGDIVGKIEVSDILGRSSK